MSSAFYGHTDVVSQLLRRGANARAADKRKRNALHWAAMNDHDAVRPKPANGPDGLAQRTVISACPVQH